MSKNQDLGKVPSVDWLLSQMEKDEEPVSDEDLKKYNYMKKGFLTAVRRAGEIERGVDAVFDLKGFLLRCAEGLLPLRPALATRGGIGEPKPLPRQSFMGRVVKLAGGARLDVSTRQRAKGIEIVVNAWDEKTSTEIRPLCIELRDPEGKQVLEVATAEEGDGPPVLEHLFPGEYVVSLSWADHREDIRLALVEERPEESPK